MDGEIIHKPINGLACDPEDPCSPEGTCTEGICESNTKCECTLDIDCPQPENKCLGVAYCDSSGDKPVCAIKPESIVVCEGVDSDCEVNECVPATGKCVVQPIDDGTVCNDGTACTLADTCKNGVCGGGEDLDCSDGLYCNGKESCDPNKGCQPGNSPDTDDGIECTVDACDEDLDAVTHTPNNAVCDNGQYCDGKETCDISKGCLNGDAPSLDDGIPCTKDSCDEEADAVTHTPDNAFCDNGEACDGKETCDAQKGCLAGEAPDLDDGIPCTVDSCDAETGLPVHTPDDSLCDNKLYCDGLETCDAQKGCVAGKAPELSDGVECTVDTCDEEVDAIKHTPKDAFCDNGQFCDGLESCDVQKGCMAGKAPEVSDGVACTQDSCDEANDVIVNAVDDGFCNNGQFCDGEETCDKALDCQAGDAPTLDDGVDCTKDSCDEVNDVVVHKPDNSFCDDGTGSLIYLFRHE